MARLPAPGRSTYGRSSFFLFLLMHGWTVQYARLVYDCLRFPHPVIMPRYGSVHYVLVCGIKLDERAWRVTECALGIHGLAMPTWYRSLAEGTCWKGDIVR
jgi:hypothetical protein